MTTIDIRAPQEQEGTKTVVKTWLVKPGERVKKNAAVVELETDKVAVEVAADADGTLAEILLDEGADAEPGALLGRLETEQSNLLPLWGRCRTKCGGGGRPLRFAPLTTSPKGRGETALSRRATPSSGDQSRSGIHRGHRRGRARDSGRRGKGALQAHGAAHARPRTREGHHPHPARFHAAQHRRAHDAPAVGVPHVTAVFECDCSAIVAHRAAHKAAFEGKGAALTYTAYFVSASAAAMQAAPAVNGRWTDNAIEIFDDVNIGVGTALPGKGLVVPVIRRAQDLSLFDIALRLTDLTARARDGKLAPADVQSGTFSMSNHGVSGTLIAAPIVIVQGQSAILGIGKMEKRAVVRDDKVVVRPMCYVTLTIDHRVLDGAQCNAWLTKFVETIENWK